MALTVKKLTPISGELSVYQPPPGYQYDTTPLQVANAPRGVNADTGLQVSGAPPSRFVAPTQPNFFTDVGNFLGDTGRNVNKYFIQPTLDTGAKVANQFGAAGVGLGGIGSIAFNAATGNDQGVNDAALATKQAINYFLGHGVRDVGGYQRPETVVSNDPMTSLIKPIAQATAEVAPYVVPLGGIGKAGSLVVRAGKQGAANAAVSGATDVASQALNTGKVDPVEAAKAALLGGTIGAAVPVLGAGAKAVVKRAADIRAQPGVNPEAGFAKIPTALGEEVVKSAKVAIKQEEKAKITPKQETPITQTSVDPSDPFNNRSLLQRVKNDLGTRGEDDFQMLSMLKRIEKDTGRQGLVDQYYHDTGRIRASSAIADARITNSSDLKEVFGGLKKKELDAFDQYAASRAELNNYKDMQTSRSPQDNAAIVAQGNEKFGTRFEAMNRYYKEQAQHMADAGIISPEKLQSYLASDNYVRIQRDVEDLVNPQLSSSQSRSFKSTTATQKRTGSERAILSPTRSLLKRTQQVEQEVNRNKAATNTIDMLQEFGLAKQVKEPHNKNTVGRFVNGKKEYWEVPGDIKQAMESVNPHIQGVVAQIISAPVRLLRAGATGLSAPFALKNYLRDQSASAIQSKQAWQTHNPVNIIKSLGSAARDFGGESTDPLWKKFEEFSGNQTIYDELRNQRSTNATLRELRMGEKGRVLNRVIAPVRTLEDFIGITEKATRFQNFKGIYKKVLDDTGNEQEAMKQATIGARKNSTDFNRSGDFTRTMNLFVPYFNASVQGTRSLGRAFKERPIATSVKTLSTVALPSVASTLYNYADPERRKAYESINDYEKQDNIIIIGPNAHQAADGHWEGIIKLPKPQGYRELTDPIRDVTEAFAKKTSEVNVGNMLQDVLGALSGPIDTSSGSALIGSVTPQQVKPFVQLAANKDFYSGNDIVPQYMKDETSDPTQRAYKGTSGSARIIAKQFGVSPIQVEKFFKDAGASVGQYGLNVLDTVGTDAGVFPKDQIGGKSPVTDVVKGFGEATGNVLQENKTAGRKYIEARTASTSGLDNNEQAAYQALHPQTKNFLGDKVYEKEAVYDPAARLDIYNRFPKVFEADKKLDQYQRSNGSAGNPLFDLPPNQVKKVLEKDNLPPGATDPELSKLRQTDWYAEYQTKKSAFFDQLATKAKADGRAFGTSSNPYPATPPDVQQMMNQYNTLPKGTGERSAWIKANPDAWNSMQAQFAAVDNWQNVQRDKRGLASTEGAAGIANGFGTSNTSSYSRYKKRPFNIDPYGFTVNPNSVNVSIKKPAAGKKAVAYKSTRNTTAKPKVTLKKATA